MSEVDLSVQYYNELFIIFIFALVAVFVINIIPFFSYFFDLFFVMIHELGHLIMSGITNAVIWGFQIFSRDSGRSARVPGTGSDFWIKPAGYLGVSIFSAGLILLVGFPQFAPVALGTLGIIILLLVATYGRYPTENPETRYPHLRTLLIGAISACIMIGLGFFGHPSWSIFFLAVLGLQGAYTSLKALKDLAKQVRFQQMGQKEYNNIDPVRFAEIFKKFPLLRSPMFWVRVWSLVSILLLGGAIWFTWLRNMVLIETA